MRRPYNGRARVTRPYGVVDAVYANYPGSKHPGTDYGLAENYPLVAAISGKVTTYPRGNTKTGRGNEAVITNGSTQVKYCHLNQIDVANGSVVTEGQQVGLTGWTGYVLPKSPEGSHLHFEVLKNGSYVDPETQYNQGGEVLTLQTARILAERVLGRAGAINGATDTDLNKNHVGKDANAKILEFEGSTEGKAYQKRLADTVANAARVPVLEAKVTELGKAVAIKDKEIESLKAQVGDNTKWNTLKALLRELVGTK